MTAFVDDKTGTYRHVFHERREHAVRLATAGRRVHSESPDRAQQLAAIAEAAISACLVITFMCDSLKNAVNKTPAWQCRGVLRKL